MQLWPKTDPSIPAAPKRSPSLRLRSSYVVSAKAMTLLAVAFSSGTFRFFNAGPSPLQELVTVAWVNRDHFKCQRSPITRHILCYLRSSV